MTAVFLDFDGVLFNSVKEAYLLSRFAYKNINPTEKIDTEEYNHFAKLRYLITKSWHFYYIWEAISGKITEEELPKLINPEYKNQECTDFDKKYVACRENLMKENYDFWQNLDTPYDIFYRIKNTAKKAKQDYIILSNKEKMPIENRLRQYNFDNIKIFASSDLKNYKNKAEFISEYIKNNHIEKSFFVDDSIDNLNECKDIKNLTTLHAGWGYVKEGGLSQTEVAEILENG